MSGRNWAIPAACAILLAAASCKRAVPKSDPLLQAYTLEQDANDAQKQIALDYQQTQGARIYRASCVWCHADATPAGPSNRSNLSPTPPLLGDGTAMNPLGEEFLQNVIALGGSAMGKSAEMPAWGRTLSPDDIRAVIAYMRAVAQPSYTPPPPVRTAVTGRGTQ